MKKLIITTAVTFILIITGLQSYNHEKTIIKERLVIIDDQGKEKISMGASRHSTYIWLKGRDDSVNKVGLLILKEEAMVIIKNDHREDNMIIGLDQNGIPVITFQDRYGRVKQLLDYSKIEKQQ